MLINSEAKEKILKDSKILDRENEEILPNEKEVEEETTRLVERYKDADPVRARAYIEGVLTNEAVFMFLENTKA